MLSAYHKNELQRFHGKKSTGKERVSPPLNYMSLSTLKQVKRVDLVLNDLNKHLPSINLETFTCKLSSMEKVLIPFFAVESCEAQIRSSLEQSN